MSLRNRLASAVSVATTTGEEECEVEVFTSTFAEGTLEQDIILSWEPAAAEQIRNNLQHRHPQDTRRPYLVGLVGNPGSGKTTSCTALCDLLDNGNDCGCFVVPFDGYHYSLDQLSQMPNAHDLIYRRGAPDTFDAAKLQNDLHRIRDGTESVIKIPGFDHAVGDPHEDQHEFVRSQHNIVLCEGLYLLHDDNAWKATKELLDFTIFVNADVDLCVERLKVRNQCIPGYSMEEIEERCEVVDRANANTVERSKHRADLVVDSAAQRSMTTTISDGTPQSEIQLSWEEDMAARIRRHVEANGSSGKPYMLSVVGGPGCGKTTSCRVLSSMLSDLGCMVMPFDGYHIPLAELEAQPNADDLIYRRGAPDTFDHERLKRDLQSIRSSNEKFVSVPGFDHAQGDPQEGEHEFDRSKHKVLLCEGLYLLHDNPAWESLKSVFDYSIFVNSDVDTCIERLKVRNKCIPGYTEEEIEIRCEEVDRVNALTVERSKWRADLVVESVAN